MNPENTNPQEKVFKKKVCMLGSFAVGKTSLVGRYVDRIYIKENYLTTVGAKVDVTEVNVDGKQVKLMIWDMAGEETLSERHKQQLGGASGYLLVIDGTRSDTLKHAKDIQAAVEKIHKIPFILVINKVDLKETWEVKEQEIEALDQEGWRLVKTSAETGEGVEKAFLWIARLMIEG